MHLQFDGPKKELNHRIPLITSHAWVVNPVYPPLIICIIVGYNAQKTHAETLVVPLIGVCSF